MTFKFRKRRKSFQIDAATRPSIQAPEEEQLLGSVQGKEASAPEEHYANALTKAGLQYVFRYVMGAPKGKPGWKELDFVIQAAGVIYLDEVDTAFTHRNKAQKDFLHDALAVNDPELNTMGTIWPFVTHVDGDSDLASKENAKNFVRQRFGR